MLFIDFLLNHWVLSLAFVVLSILLILSEAINKRGSAISVSPSEATQLINKQNALVIDVRDEAAFKQGHIVGAIHMLPTLLLTDEKIMRQPDKPILLVCKGGYQSVSLGRQLRKKGLTALYHLKGGIDNWVNSGLLLTKGK